MAPRIHDVCVIGSGASGAVVAGRLAAAGSDVVVIEQGGHVAPGTYLHELIPGFETARARTVEGAWVEHGYPWTACVVGGGTRFYAGISMRFRPVDFRADPHLVPDALPARWPFEYSELMPHYEQVERWIGVSRSCDDPALPPLSPGPLPPHQPGPRGRLLEAAASSLGLCPFPTPVTAHSVPYAGAPACESLTPCTDFSCPIGAKGDVYQRILAPNLTRPNLRLHVGCKAVRLVESSPGKVTAVECLDLGNGTRRTFHARTFVVAGNAVQTAALLLRSRSRYSPDGLGNSGDMVGRGLCFKVSQNVTGHLDAAPPGNPDGRVERYSSVVLTDFYLDPECPTGLGGLVLEANHSDPVRAADSRVLRLECLLADQPIWSNRVTLNWAALDRHGLPRLVMDYRPHPVDLDRLRYVRTRATEILKAAGATEIHNEPLDFTLGSAHLHGTCRMGTDPAVSVCTPDGALRGAENVYIGDGAVMPFPSGINPTLTIQALAHRLAGRLLSL
ncbi:GMC oxidoreductase [Streptomyces capitiformicae]|uniref:Gluconate dehydrogenase n=1 Tax=Streptomyces capitiformicae TaxID=2014920 RepID=A0A919GH96_9ACTN|nr:GMC family oxidoreductase [Streptomyces capitiformicae]GHH84743.1 gluconate dehydrogenase [Streptomyces capitiformicae]